MTRRIVRGLTEDELLEQQIEDARHRRFLKAMALKTEIGLSDDERYSLAQMIPGVDKDSGGSWKALNPKQLSILINMLEGYGFISALMNQRFRPIVQSPQEGWSGSTSTYTTGSGMHTHTINPSPQAGHIVPGTLLYRPVLMKYTGSEWVPFKPDGDV